MTETPHSVERAVQDRRAALVERIGTIADLACGKPLEGELGDIAYDLLRQAAAQIASDRLRLAQPEPSADREAGERLAIQLAHHVVIGLLEHKTADALWDNLTPDFFDRVAFASLQPRDEISLSATFGYDSGRHDAFEQAAGICFQVRSDIGAFPGSSIDSALMEVVAALRAAAGEGR